MRQELCCCVVVVVLCCITHAGLMGDCGSFLTAISSAGRTSPPGEPSQACDRSNIKPPTGVLSGEVAGGGCKVSHTTTRCRPIFPGWSGALSSLNHYAVGGVFLSVSSLTWLTEITWGASGTTCEWLRKGSEKARRGGCVPWITSGLEMYGQTAAMMLSFARSMPFEK